MRSHLPPSWKGGWRRSGAQGRKWSTTSTRASVTASAWALVPAPRRGSRTRFASGPGASNSSGARGSGYGYGCRRRAVTDFEGLRQRLRQAFWYLDGLLGDVGPASRPQHGGHSPVTCPVCRKPYARNPRTPFRLHRNQAAHEAGVKKHVRQHVRPCCLAETMRKRPVMWEAFLAKPSSSLTTS